MEILMEKGICLSIIDVLFESVVGGEAIGNGYL